MLAKQKTLLKETETLNLTLKMIGRVLPVYLNVLLWHHFLYENQCNEALKPTNYFLMDGLKILHDIPI